MQYGCLKLNFGGRIVVLSKNFVDWSRLNLRVMNTSRILLFACLSLHYLSANGQEAQFLPRFMTEHEKQMMEPYLQSFDERGITVPPPFTSLRTAAEWEEVQALVITWTGQYNS